MNRYFVKRTSCPACGSTDFKKRFSVGFDDPGIRSYLNTLYDPQGGVEYEYLEGAEFILSECSNCGLVFQEDIANDELMHRLYENWIDPQKVVEAYASRDDVDYYKRYAAEIINLIVYFNKMPDDLKFFDFGMGWGKWARMAKAFGVDSWGTELSRDKIAYAQKNGVSYLPLEEVPQHQFDFINTEQVFEHIPSPLGTLQHLKKGLKPGGIIRISVPNGDGIDRILKKAQWTASRKSLNSMMVVSPLEHINTYRKESILKMAQKAGMEDVKPKATYLGFRNIKDLGKLTLRKPYYKYMKTGDFAFYFRAESGL
jgi:2-polyprenyl-3-methyl-5-hydroxy-6-metoxy-1,4-benzoquinol methylase